jgi:hypothetical protein
MNRLGFIFSSLLALWRCQFDALFVVDQRQFGVVYAPWGRSRRSSPSRA